MKIETRNPFDKTLQPHPLLKKIPDEWADDDHPEFISFREDIKENGIRDEILITDKDLVVDGRRRLRAARLLALKEIPTRIVPEGEVAGIILSKSLGRRYTTVSHRAYALFFVIEPAYQEALDRHKKRLQSGNRGTISGSTENGPTVGDLARRFGISREILDYAAQVHELFKTYPELKQKCEAGILDGESSLGNVIAGFKGQQATKGKARPAPKPFFILERAAVGVINQIEELDELAKGDDRDEFRRHLAARFLEFRKFDAEKCKIAAKRLHTLANEFELLAKRAGKTED
jgi:hypothetical protein